MDYLSRRSTYPKRYLQILTSPNIHSGVVLADVKKVFAFDSEQSSGHSRRSVSQNLFIQNILNY